MNIHTNAQERGHSMTAYFYGIRNYSVDGYMECFSSIQKVADYFSDTLDEDEIEELKMELRIHGSFTPDAEKTDECEIEKVSIL